MTLSRKLSAALLLSTALVPLRAHAGDALPSGGSFTAGAGTIAQTGDLLTVTQASETGVVSWDSFSIGAGAAAHFDNGSGATLNRVTGHAPSAIDGSLTATGSLYLVNGAGVVVGPDGMIATGGSFVASTHDVSDAQFLAGGAMDFRGDSAAAVVNLGAIESAQGDVVMIARRVENSGRIAAREGRAALAAGYAVTLADAADGALSIRIGGADTEAVNAGAIRAAAVEMRAQGGNVYALAGNTDGVVKAQTVRHEGGRILLDAGDGGSVQVAGTLDAAGQTGGAVDVFGEEISVSGRIDVSAAGQGRRGGDAMVFADGGMAFSGTISATGGEGGEGGFVETSGKAVAIADSARVDTRAEGGATGEWLIDPTDLHVGGPSEDVAAATVETNLFTTDVTLDSDDGGSGVNGDIFINDDIMWVSGNTLTLDAVRNIVIDRQIRGANGGLTINAGGTITTAAFGTVNVETFTLNSGDWRQVDVSPASFAADTFQFDPVNASFLRAVGGDGSSGDPYQIEDLYGLQGIASESLLSRHFELVSNIAASGTAAWNGGAGFLPIGIDGVNFDPLNGANGFTGSFDGGNHTISGLTIDRDAMSLVGLFGYAGSGSSLSNLVLQGGEITGAHIVGSLAGQSVGPISNVHSSTVVNVGSGVAGGLVGAGGSITQSSATGAVNAAGAATSVGGLAGTALGTVDLSYATGTVTVGGAPNDNNDAGGLIGSNDGTITRSFATGNVSMGGNVAGGLVGHNSGQIINAYATGAVTASAYAGGLAGINNGSIDSSYSTGMATTTDYDSDGGALGQIGFMNEDGQTHLYWDTDTSGTTEAAGYNFADSFTGIEGKTTAELQGALPDGFDASVWGTGAGLYPYLKAMHAEAPTVISGFVYSDAGVTPLGGASVNALSGGAVRGVGSSGANGYYYITVDSADVKPTGVLAYLNNAAVKGLAATDIVTAEALSDLDIFGDTVRIDTQAASVDATIDNLDAMPGSIADADLDILDVGATLSTQNGAGLILNTASDYILDRHLISQGSLTASTGGVLAVAGTRYVGATGGALTLNGDMAWSDASHLYITGANIGDVVLNGAVNAPDGQLTINATSTLTDATTATSTGAIDVGVFTLSGIDWLQVGAGLPGFAAADFRVTGAAFIRALGGDGSVADPYQLFDVYGLQGIYAEAASPLNYVLAQDIDASGTAAWNGGAGFAPVILYGNFDGAGHTIDGLTVNRPTQTRTGLFERILASTRSITVQDLTLTNVDITGLSTTGALAGLAQASNGNTLTLSGITVDGAVNGHAITGGMIGQLLAPTGAGVARDLHADVQVTATGDNVGGLIGQTGGNQTISDSSATGDVSGVGNVGGLLGYTGADVIRSFATGNVSSSYHRVGGLIGYAVDGSVDLTYATGTLTNNGPGAIYTGGLIGDLLFTSVTRSYASGDVVSDGDYAGGLIGRMQGGLSDVENVYALGAVTADNYAGGLVGYLDGGSVSSAYSTGVVTATTSAAGGLVGRSDDSIAYSNVYWDRETSGQFVAAGQNDDSVDPQIISQTTAQLQGTLPDGFDAGVWSTGAGLYPYLSDLYVAAPDTIAGFVYSNAGSTVMNGADVSILSGGSLIASVTSAANGYYYYQPAPGETDAAGVLSYLDGGAFQGAAYTDTVTAAALGDMDIWAGAFRIATNSAAFSDVSAALATTIGSVSDTDLSFLVNIPDSSLRTNGGSAEVDLYLDAGADFLFDMNLFGGGSLTVSTGETFSIDNSSWSLQSLEGDLTVNGDFAWNTATTLNLLTAANNGTITLNGDVTAVNGEISIRTSGAVSNVTATATGDIDVGSFYTFGIDWTQVGAGIPSFRAGNFVTHVSSFTRALGGDGSVANPYQLFDIYGLQGVDGSSTSAVNYVLTQDIDASVAAGWDSGAGFNPVDLYGNFDGGGFTIDGLTINRGATTRVGLFSRVRSSQQAITVSDLNLTNVDITGGAVAGGLAADIDQSDGGPISLLDITVTGAVTGDSAVGGVAGSFAAANGANLATRLRTDVAVTANTGSAGGLMAVGGAALTVSDSSAEGDVSGKSTVGGLLGSTRGSVLRSFAAGAVSLDNGATVGGLIGRLLDGGTVDLSYATGDVTHTNGGANVGGLIGWNDDSAVTRSFATGDVTTIEGYNVGGLIGRNTDSSIENSYATGAVSAASEAGGLIGDFASGSLTNSYATGLVTSADADSGGGVAGSAGGGDPNAVTLSGVFWNTESSGQASGIGRGDGVTGFTGLTTAQMRQLSSFTDAGWSIDDEGGTASVWRIYDGATAPLLRDFLTDISVTADDQSKTYDGSVFGGGFTYTKSDPAAVLQGSVGGSAATATDAGTYTIGSALYSDQFGYDIDFTAGTLTINSADLVLTITPDAASKTYGDALTLTGFGSSGLQNGDSISSVTLTSAGTAADADVGTYDITPSGAVFGSGSASNYAITYSVLTDGLTVTPRTLTLGLTGSVEKVYDGDADATLTLANYSGFDLLFGDTVSLTGFADGAYNTAARDVNKPVSVTGLGLAGTDSGNYTLASASVSANVGLVTPKTLTFDFVAQDKQYTGTTITTGSLTNLSGVVPGDTFGFSGTVAFATPDAGANKIVNYSALALHGLDAGNYQLSHTSGQTTATITPRPLTITANNASRTYDGAAYSGGNGVSYSGFIGGQNASVLGGSLVYGGTAQGAVNAGTYAITASGLTSTNYAITFDPGVLTIGKAALTITPQTASKTYGDTLALTGFDTIGLQGSDSIASVTMSSSGASASNDVGTYDITSHIATFGSGLASNYDITYSVRTDGLTVSQRPLNVTANNLSRVYGAANPALGYTIAPGGLRNGDTLSGSLATAADASSDVGAYAITQGALSASANYTLNFTAGQLTVTPRTLTLGLTGAVEKIYDGGRDATLTLANYTGLDIVSGDDLTLTGFSSGQYDTADAGTGKSVSVFGVGLAGADAGNYSLALPGAAGLVGRITPKALTVTAADHARTFDGTAYSGGNGVSYSGFITGEDSSDLGGSLAYGGTAQGAVNAGTYAITASGLTSTNYAITFDPGALTIGKAALTVTPQTTGKTYGDAAALSAFGVSGLQGSDSIASVTLASAGAAAGADVGTYDITSAGAVFGSGLASNYAIIYSALTDGLTVTPRALTVTANDVAKTYDGAAYSGGAGVSYSGFANGEDSSVLGGALVWGGTAQGAVNAGTYSITVSGLTSSNYAIAFDPGVLTIGAAPLNLAITPQAASKIYGETLSLTAFDAVGLQGSDSIASVTLASAGTAASANVGTYDITASNAVFGSGSASNYAITYSVLADGLTVTPRGLTVTALDRSRVYGDANPELLYTLGGAGLVNGDTLAGSLATAAGATSDVGAYAITQGALTAGGNYALTFNGGALTVTPRALSLGLTGLVQKTYDGNASAALALANYSGLDIVSGDDLTLTGFAAGSYADGAAGTGKTVSVSGLGLGGADAGNYTLAATAVSGAVGVVAPRTLTAALAAEDKIYDGTTVAAGVVTGLSNLIAGDAVAADGLFAFADANAGTGKTVDVTGLSLSGVDAGNYVLASTSGSATADIAPRALSVTAEDQSRIYGEANPALTYALGGDGLVNGDTLSGALAATADASSDIGAYAITLGSLSGGGNYVLSFAGAELTVTPRALTVAADSLSRSYGEANPALTYALGGMGLANGDSHSGALATSADQHSAVGVYAISRGSLSAGANYVLTFEGGALAVTPRPLIVTADSVSRLYGDANPALTYTLAGMGMANGDTLTGALTTMADAASNPGRYMIDRGDLAASANYALSFTPGELFVLPLAPETPYTFEPAPPAPGAEDAFDPADADCGASVGGSGGAVHPCNVSSGPYLSAAAD